MNLPPTIWSVKFSETANQLTYDNVKTFVKVLKKIKSKTNNTVNTFTYGAMWLWLRTQLHHLPAASHPLLDGFHADVV